MTTFAICHGATALLTWELESGRAAFHPQVSHPDGVLVLAEADKCAFVLSPAPDGQCCRITIGNVPLSDLVSSPEQASGVSIGGQLFWPEHPYFESARGHTRILVESQTEGAEPEAWATIHATEVYVLPSKLGEDRYVQMTEDLRHLSHSLLVDLYGKSEHTHDLRFARASSVYHSAEQELESIERVLDRLGSIFDAIGLRPASATGTVIQRRRYWGGERLTPTSVAWLTRNAAPLSAIERPLAIQDTRRIEHFDVPEHRAARALLDLLVRRAGYCATVAKAHVRSIMSEQHLRHVRLSDGPTIFETVDLPRIRRLQEASRRAARSASLARAMTSLFFLRDSRPALLSLQGGTFQRSAEYRSLLKLIRRYLLANAVWYHGHDLAEVTKLTSRLFEQWCYLQLVEAFRSCGLDLREWSDALRQNVRARFILDFDRGLAFEGDLGSDLRVRLRYEPWILSEAAAAEAGETLCRGKTGVAWSPDVVIECLQRQGGTWSTVYGIVLDSKYTAVIGPQHWVATSKYLQIRSTQTRRQVVRQLWLVAPGSQPSITSNDPSVTFDHTGASCRPDEAVLFRLLVVPGHSENVETLGDGGPFAQFARGTISFLQREFGARTAHVA